MKLSTIFLKALNIYLFIKIFQNVKIVMLKWNILQYLTKILWQYFNSNERLEIFLTCFCNILCYVGNNSSFVILIFAISKFRNVGHSTIRCSEIWPPPLISTFIEISEEFSDYVVDSMILFRYRWVRFPSPLQRSQWNLHKHPRKLQL